jgi:hypothetical protein
MHEYKSTVDILTRPWQNEVFESKTMDYPWKVTPPTKDWDYNREITIEDVDIWEVITERSGGLGVYAAWAPYAEFYMVTTGWKPGTSNDRKIETFYGPGAQEKVYNRATELDMPIATYKTWIDAEDVWKYKDTSNSIFSQHSN